MCGCGCELAMILATARLEAEASAAVSRGAPAGATRCPDVLDDVFARRGRALIDATERIVLSIVTRVAAWGAVR